MSTSAEPFSPIVRVLVSVEVLVLLVSGVGLLFVPESAAMIWPWVINIGTARFLGAVYMSALVAVGSLALRSDWTVGHVILPMIGTFTTAALIFSIVSVSDFAFERPVAWLWFVLYVALPVISLFFVRKYWGRPIPDAIQIQGTLRTVLMAWAALNLLYAIALPIVPGPSTSWWPWTTEIIDARIYCAEFLTVAVGCWLLTRTTHTAAVRSVGWTLATIGFLAVAGRAPGGVLAGQLSFAPGIVVWHAYFVVTIVLGIILVRHARPESG